MTIRLYNYMTIQLYDPVHPVYPISLAKSLEPWVSEWVSQSVNILFLEIHPSKWLHLKIFVIHKNFKHHVFGWFLFPDVHTLWHSIANNVLRPPHKMSRSVLRIFEAAEVSYKCTAANWVPIGSLFSLNLVFNCIGSSVSVSWIQNLFNNLMLKIFLRLYAKKLQIVGLKLVNVES